MKCFLIVAPLFFVCFLSVQSKAGSAFTLPTLDPSQTDPLFKTLAADLAFRPVDPASSYGLWGFSFGVTGIATNASPISSIIGTSTNYLYAGDISLVLQVPYGIAVEAGILPNISISGTNFTRIGLAGKWTFTDVFFKSFPINSAVRTLYTNASLSYTQPLSNGTVNVSYNTNITGAQLVVSKTLLVFEPYLAYGILQHSSSISGSGTANLFNSSFPVGTTSASGNTSSGWFEGGLQIKLAILTLAAEYDNMFGSDTYAARFAFRF